MELLCLAEQPSRLRRLCSRGRRPVARDDGPAVAGFADLARHTIFTAASLEEALEHAHDRPSIGLLLSDDRRFHGLTGIRTVDTVRAALGREVEAAIVTGDTSPATLQETQAPKLRLLHKPLDEKQLRELMGGPALLAGVTTRF
ncbi:MAG: hypothetical protein ABI460_02840 [Caldimonas sp.]